MAVATTQSHILGFDLRLPAASYLATDWLAARRQRFLLRPEVEQPLSVDRMVWPSLFDFPGCHLLSSPDSGRAAFETDNHRERCCLLWSSLPRLRAALPSDLGRLAKSCETIRIDLESAAPVLADGPWGYVLDQPIHPDTLSKDWQFVGFDVADSSLCSALSNCGYFPDEQAALADAWAPKLNDAGLLVNRADADAFRALSDRRIREHAPFFVLALYRRKST